VKNPLRHVEAIAAVLFLCGCGPDWKESRTYPSPDGRHVVVAIVELQGANDPEPWWQHVSIFRAGEERKNREGNLFVYSSATPPVVEWRGPADLFIQMAGVSYSFTGPLDSQASREVSITAVIKQPDRGQVGQEPSTDQDK
jgi:hypothetical protein